MRDMNGYDTERQFLDGNIFKACGGEFFFQGILPMTTAAV
jgi:hypothetical protein